MGSKQWKITDSSLSDRISDLPSNIIECILDHTPIRDAVATSILSTEWRHKWRRIGNLVFDKEFVDDVIIRRKQEEPALMNLEYCNIIGNILLLHLGPIRKFVLHIPNFGNSSPLGLLSSWMLFVSQNGVKELTVEAHHARIRLPSYFFHCKELQYLKIGGNRVTLDLHPPRDFKGFCNLLTLDLHGFLNGAEVSDLVSKCPMLESLLLHHITPPHPLVIDGHRLRLLSANCSNGTALRLKKLCSVIVLILGCGALGKMVYAELIDIFTSVPNVGAVFLGTLHTITAMPKDAPEILPITLYNLMTLTIKNIALHLQQCIQFIFCIFKSSPRLYKLNLEILSLENEEDEAALNFLDTQTRKPHTLSNLSSVNIKGLNGSKVETKFLKLILSCSPVLETMYLTSKNILSEAEFTMMSELLQCPRPSPRAQVIYSKLPGDSPPFALY